MPGSFHLNGVLYWATHIWTTTHGRLYFPFTLWAARDLNIASIFQGEVIINEWLIALGTTRVDWHFAFCARIGSCHFWFPSSTIKKANYLALSTQSTSRVSIGSIKNLVNGSNFCGSCRCRTSWLSTWPAPIFWANLGCVHDCLYGRSRPLFEEKASHPGANRPLHFPRWRESRSRSPSVISRVEVTDPTPEWFGLGYLQLHLHP